MKKAIILSLTAMILLTACDKMKKEISLDISDAEKHIVINGILNTDSLIKVRISQSQNILDDSDIKYLTSADIKLYENNNFVEYLYHTDTGVYTSTIRPEIGKEYKLTVDYGNMKTATATTTLKTPNKIIKVDTSMQIGYSGYYNEETDEYIEDESIHNYDISFKVKIQDDAETKNYYFIALAVMQPEYTYDEPPVFIGYKEYTEVFNTNDVVLKNYNQEYTLDGIRGMVFSDEKFNGTHYNLNFNSTIYDSGLEKKPIIKVKLLTVPKDVYQFILTRNKNQETDGDPFSQPVQIFTNIENGLGIFSYYTMDVDSFIIN
jgi:hypothetical protein